MEQLLEWDQALFFIINDDFQNPILNEWMPLWRNKKFWIPFYVLLLIHMLWKHRAYFLYFVLGVVVTITTADTVSSKVIKPAVERIRPCNDRSIGDQVHLLVHCGGGYSFTSSHATNHFALGIFFFMTIGPFIRRWRWLFVLWAASVAFSQVYVGVHYPLDILGGALLGTLIGFSIASLMQKIAPIERARWASYSPPR